MPGTIQVSVLDFKGPHSSSPSSEISVKVSMGKREYQTWDKGEFSFPLTTLRDNLIITLQDAEGNEISHTGVETRLVVEKGVWDDIFSLEGGGHVHMKLQFVLSEEERQRIRIMRESAVKKKRDELCNSGHGSPKSASVGYNEVSGSQESFFQNGLLANEASLVSVPLAKFYSDGRDRSYSIQKQKSTNDRDENEGNTSAKSMSEAVNVDLTELYHQDSVPSELEKANNSKKQGPAGKAHSNIRKMITAFEDSLNQDVKPSIKPPPQIKNIGMDSFLANSHLNEVETDKIIPSKVTLGRINTKEFEQTKISIREKVQTIGFVNPIYGAASSKETEQWKESTVACIQTERKILDLKNRFKVKQKESDEKEEKKYSEDFRRASTIEKAAFSHRMLDKHPKGNQSWNLFSKRQHSRTSLVTKESGDKIFQRDTREAERTSNEKLKTMAIFCGDHCSFRSSDLWIFPGEAKCLCITTGGKQIMDLMGGFWDETNTHQRKLSARDPKNPGEVNTDAGTAIKANEDGQTSKKLRPKVDNSMDPEDSIGPVGQGSKKGDGASTSSSVPTFRPRVWQPGVDELEEGEELQCDPSAYNSLHAFHIGWPCLSFDIVRDSLGSDRKDFPHTVYFVAGTQAEKASWNSIGVFKVSNVSGTRRELVPTKSAEDDPDMDAESSDSENSEDEEEGGSGAPVLQLRKVAHHGCVNRIRAMTQNPHICASWADSGHVQVWDFSSHLNALAESETEGVQGASSVFNQAPLANFRGHKDEGYAIDWSPVVAGRLVTGDCKNCIHLWEPTSGSTWNIDATPFVGHSASVEDLQWSPSEPHAFVSCSVDGTIAIWDIRLGKSPAASFKAHDADVNVISWNRQASCMLASGSDDGTFSIHDFRLLKDGNTVVAHFKYHKYPVTSIEWSPHEASTLAVSSFDNQLTIWDLSLEKDEEEEAEFKAQTREQVNAPEDLPPQLLFVHQGQKDLKELHWHAQIPGMIVSTAADGFNILMPSNIQSTLSNGS